MRRLFIFLFFYCSFIGTSFADPINVATWNIRINIKKDSVAGNIWANRREAIVKMVQSNDFDIWGVQEDFNKELNELNSMLPYFSRKGFPNHENGKVGTFNSVFYKKKRFDEQKSGMFYFAPREDVPMLGWNGKYIRSCTWVKLVERNTSRVFWVFNTHMDYAGGEVERESCKMLLRKIREIAGENAAVIVMGDLNFNQDSPGYEILTKSGVIEDCINVAQKKIKVAGTFNNFEKDRKSDKRLDHILVTKNINVLEYNVLLDTYPDQYSENRFPSDHFPVVVKINLEKK